MAKEYNPGETIPTSGQYEIYDDDGTRTRIERTLVKDKIFPPTLETDQHYRLVDKTKTR